MGDKSPKSRQKNDKQKKVKTKAVADEKQRVIDFKSKDGGQAPPKK